MTRSTGYVEGAPRTILKAEGLAAFFLAVSLYNALLGFSWKTYLLLVLVPDLAMLGYLAGPRIGAITYNAAHSYIGPFLLAFLGSAGVRVLLAPAFIWISHIGFDRMLGYGLKYPTAFRETHLGPTKAGGG